MYCIGCECRPVHLLSPFLATLVIVCLSERFPYWDEVKSISRMSVRYVAGGSQMGIMWMQYIFFGHVVADIVKLQLRCIHWVLGIRPFSGYDTLAVLVRVFSI